MKDRKDFLIDIVNSELKLYKMGIKESIIANEWDKNLFCIFNTKEKVLEYLLYLNKL